VAAGGTGQCIGASMRSALPDLGLKIRGARATVDLLVLDHIEKPDDN